MIDIQNYGKLNQRQLCDIAAFVKQSAGVWNNVAQAEMFESYHAVRATPLFKHQVKKAFNDAMNAYAAYEKRLLNPTWLRFFCVKDMPPEVRKKYGDISDRDYYEFWQNLGWSVREQHKSFITALENKFFLALDNHNVKYARVCASCLVSERLLMIATQNHKGLITDSLRALGYRSDLVERMCQDFYMKDILDKWSKACSMILPKNGVLTEIELRNINNGIDDLQKILGSTDNMFDGLKKSIADYEDVFRTKGECKKALREAVEQGAELCLTI